MFLLHLHIVFFLFIYLFIIFSLVFCFILSCRCRYIWYSNIINSIVYAVKNDIYVQTIWLQYKNDTFLLRWKTIHTEVILIGISFVDRTKLQRIGITLFTLRRLDWTFSLWLKSFLRDLLLSYYIYCTYMYILLQLQCILFPFHRINTHTHTHRILYLIFNLIWKVQPLGDWFPIFRIVDSIWINMHKCLVCIPDTSALKIQKLKRKNKKKICQQQNYLLETG